GSGGLGGAGGSGSGGDGGSGGPGSASSSSSGSGGAGGGGHGHGCSFRAAGDSTGDASLLGLAFAGLLALRRRSVSSRAHSERRLD
ncbi:hypothetical protein, partial [Polyangium sp. 6x1]|uniref:hypothetical protein n=1 Tax=Polyangium sp. 6x1 TaxID=3042689 RepID=UPI0024826334